jgi:hypothetical protein
MTAPTCPSASSGAAIRGSSPARIGAPTGKVFHRCQLACFRSAWSATAAGSPIYLAIKGSSAAPAGESAPLPVHAQADAGTFILDAGGERWAIDLGPDDYDLPGYFDQGTPEKPGQRWQYYRSGTAGHNTLVIDGCNQMPGAPTAILGSRSDGRCKWAVIDLSAAYAPKARKVWRGAALIGRRVVIQDEVEEAAGCPIVWAMHTTAEAVAVSRREARLRLGAQELVLRIRGPAGARLVIGALPPPRCFEILEGALRHGTSSRRFVSERPHVDAAGRPVSRVEILWPRGATRLTVLLSPDDDDGGEDLRIGSLEQWLAQGLVRERPRRCETTHEIRPRRIAALQAGSQADV